MKKIYTFFVLFLMAGLLAQAQSSFVKQLPLTNGRFVGAAKDGGYIVVGSSYILKYNSSGMLTNTIRVKDSTTMELVKVLPAADHGYILLANTLVDGEQTPEVCKVDEGGKIIWRKAYFGYQSADIAEDKEGNYVFSYYTAGEVFSSHIVKIDKSGNAIWAKLLAFPFADSYASSIAITNDNKYVVAGIANGNTTVTMFDANGNQVMNKTFPFQSDLQTTINVFSNGDFLLLTNDFASNSAYVMRLSASGTIVWKKAISAAGVVTKFNTALVSDSLITLAGYKTTVGSFIDSALTVAAMKTDGTLLWEKTIATPQHAAAVSAARLVTGSYIVLASRFTFPFAKPRYNNSYVAGLTRYGNSCNSGLVSATAQNLTMDTIPSTYRYSSYNIVYRAPIVSLAYSAGIAETVICGTAPQLTTENLQTTTATVQSLSATFTAMAYPNPVADFLLVNITLVKQGKTVLELSDAYGKIVVRQEYELAAGTHTKMITMSSLSAGIYFLKIGAQNEMKRIKISKE